MKTKETNEAFTKRIIEELDKWQDGKRKERVALLIMQDETGATSIEAFGNNRGKNPELRFIGRMTGIIANNNGLYNAVLTIAKFACKIRNRKLKEVKMKEENKVSLDAMCKKLQAIEHYDDPEKAFNNLLFGFAKARHYPPEWTSRARKKGWLEVNEAVRFAKYCLHKDWWDMIN